MANLVRNPIVMIVALELYLCLGYVIHVVFGGAVSIGTSPVSVLIVEETSDRGNLTTGQLDAIESNATGSVRDWLKTHGEEDPLRVVDKDNPLDRDSVKWQEALKLPRASTPWLIVLAKGAVRFSGPLPEKIDETLSILKRYGGP